jgi:pimeloyl-[acyl-carrier protein] methyl ester esterase
MLLPGLDGSGQLFDRFIAALPTGLRALPVPIPHEQFLSYNELLPMVASAAPRTEPFALLEESFSTPLAIAYAATKPQNLVALILCAGFVRKPAKGASLFVGTVAGPWVFALKPPRFILEYLLVGHDSPDDLIDGVRRALRRVPADVLRSRFREVLKCDARNALSVTTVPIMYLRAENDRLVPASCLSDVLQIRPDTISATISAPHMLLQREPNKAAEVVLAFLQQLET